MYLDIIDGYEEDSEYLIKSYEKIKSQEFLSHLSEYLPKVPSNIIDIGAGTGRDAKWLSSLGHNVLAVEPVDTFRNAGIAIHGEGVEWLKDYLPKIEQVLNTKRKFNFVLVASVWQHLTNEQREIALGNIRKLVHANGKIAISLRHGNGAENRKCYPVNVNDMVNMSNSFGFKVVSQIKTASIQKSNQAAGVHWTWLILSVD